MQSIGEVTVLAPDHNCRHRTRENLHRPLRVRPTKHPDGTPAYMSDGARRTAWRCVARVHRQEVRFDRLRHQPYANIATSDYSAR